MRLFGGCLAVLTATWASACSPLSGTRNATSDAPSDTTSLERSFFQPVAKELTAFVPLGADTLLLGFADGSVDRMTPTGASQGVRSADGRAIVALSVLTEGRVAILVADTLAVLDAYGDLLWQVGGVGSPWVFGRDALVSDADGHLWVKRAPLVHEVARWEAFEDGHPVRTIVVERETGSCNDPDPARFASGRHRDLRARYLPMSRASLTAGLEILTGCPATYRFERRTMDADAPAEFEGRRRPVGVAPEELQAFVTTWIAQMNNSGRDGRWEWSGEELPELKPVYHRLLDDGAGRTWVWTSQPSEPIAAPPSWPLAGLPDVLWLESRRGSFDVFSPTGRIEEVVQLPAEVPYSPFGDVPELMLRGDTVWAPVADSTGVVGIGRYRVTRVATTTDR